MLVIIGNLSFQPVHYSGFIHCYRLGMGFDFRSHDFSQRQLINPVPWTDTPARPPVGPAEIRNIAFLCAVPAVPGLCVGAHGGFAVGAYQFAGEQLWGGVLPAHRAEACRLVDFLDGIPILRRDDGLMQRLVANPFRFRLADLRVVLVGASAGVIHHQHPFIDRVAENILYRCVAPELSGFAAVLAVDPAPVDAGRGDSLPVECGGNLAVGRSRQPQRIYPAYNIGGILVRHQLVLVPGALSIAVGGIRGNKLTAGFLAVQDGLDFTAQIPQMVVVHQGAEVEHIRVAALAVQAVQNGDEPASQAGKYSVRVPPDLHIVPAQPGEVFHENQIDNAFSGILQHLQKSGPLKISSAVPVVNIGPGLHPAIKHSEFGKQFPLILNAGGFIGGDVASGLCRVGSVVHA